MVNVGIIGCGVIGGVMKRWLEENNPSCKILVSDPPKGYNDDLQKADIAFISIHIPTENDGTQDLTLLKSIITGLPDIPIFIRTTLLPGTCDKLSEELNKKVFFMPEFLTERTAWEDFCAQKMIYTGCCDLMKNIFIGKKYIEMSNLEAEITKYAHNVFGAVKVTYFNGIYDVCKKMSLDYDKVQQGVLLSGYINDTHTYVPGPDGKTGYGGKCFPKDVNAFKVAMKDFPVSEMIDITAKLNESFRGNKCKI